MRFLSILITLLIIGFLAKKQLDSGSAFISYEDITGSTTHSNIPAVPTSLKDLEQFKQDMNVFIEDNNKKRFEALEGL